jgi:predicted transcriptional regulator
MATTIQVSEHVKKHLDRLRLHPRESYDDVIDRVLEDFEELGEETKARIAEAEKDIKAGRVIPHAEVKRRLGLE